MTTAVAATGGPAQAADLAIAAAPVDYVRICDAWGTGYHSIPGTETCMKFGGYARLDFNYFNSATVGNLYGSGMGWPSDEEADQYGNLPLSDLEDDYAQPWGFHARTQFDVTSKTLTDVGPVVTFIRLRANARKDSFEGYRRFAFLREVYGTIGPALFGYTQSTFDGEGAFTYNAVPDGTATESGMRSDERTNQLRLSHPMGTWGVMLGFEDPRDRYDGPKNATGDYPDTVMALTGGAGSFEWKLSGAVTDRTSGTGWAVQLNAGGTFSTFGIRTNLAYSDNAPSYAGIDNCAGICPDEGSAWSGFVSGFVAVTASVDLAATLSYADFPETERVDDMWGGAVGAYWYPTTTSQIGLEVNYAKPDNADALWQVKTRFQTSFN